MTAKPRNADRVQVIAELRRRLRTCGQYGPGDAGCGVSTGCGALDALFPERGIRRGGLVEWIGDGQASGAGTLSLLVARQININSVEARPWVVVDTRREVYPPALAALGFDLSALVIVRPGDEDEALWAYEQALRCEAVAGVWGRIERLRPVAFRRLQLAAEESEAIGLLVRSRRALSQPSWAEVRLLVKPQPGEKSSARFCVQVAYSRGQPQRVAADIAIDEVRGTLSEVCRTDETRVVPVVAELADPTTYGCRAGT